MACQIEQKRGIYEQYFQALNKYRNLKVVVTSIKKAKEERERIKN